MDNKRGPRGARNGKRKTTTKTTWDNKGQQEGSARGSERRFLTTNCTNLHEYVPRGARNGKKKTTTKTTINNKGQQEVSSQGSEKMLSNVVISCLGCRKKKRRKRQQEQHRTTKHRQSTPAVIAEASRSTRYGMGSVAESAIRDLTISTPLWFLAGLGKIFFYHE